MRPNSTARRKPAWADTKKIHNLESLDFMSSLSSWTPVVLTSSLCAFIVRLQPGSREDLLLRQGLGKVVTRWL